MNLYEKMFAVMSDSNGLIKDMTVANQYNAVSEKMMLNEVKPLLKKYKLVIFPVETTITEQPKGNKSITQVNVKYKIVDTETGDSEILSGVGNGADTQDKGAGKAFTYAYKAMLSKTFMLFSGEDTDNTHSDQITEEQKKADEKAKIELRKIALKNVKNLMIELETDVAKFEEYYKGKVDDLSLEELEHAQLQLRIKKDNKGMV